MIEVHLIGLTNCKNYKQLDWQTSPKSTVFLITYFMQWLLAIPSRIDHYDGHYSLHQSLRLCLDFCETPL